MNMCEKRVQRDGDVQFEKQAELSFFTTFPECFIGRVVSLEMPHDIV